MKIKGARTPRKKKRGGGMDEQLYFSRYHKFHEEFGIDTSILAKEAKLIEEFFEYLSNPSDEECLDIVNVSMSLAQARGIKNVLFAGAMKLEANADRYRKGENVCSLPKSEQS